MFQDPKEFRRVIAQMQRVAASNIPRGISPEDVVQQALERAFKAKARKPDQEIKPAYVWKALKSEITDTFRREEKKRRDSLKVSQDFGIREHPDIFEYLGMLPRQEAELIERRLEVHGESWKELSTEMEQSESNLRQMHHRVWTKLEAEMFLNWFQQGREQELNHYKLSKPLAVKIAQLAETRGIRSNNFEKLFEQEDRYRTVENAILVLGALAPKQPDIYKFLEAQAKNRGLSRGSVNYLVETLISHNSPEHIKALMSFMRNFRDMPSSVSRDYRAAREQAPVSGKCLFDFFTFRPIGNQVSRETLVDLSRDYMRGIDDVDTHRTAAWLLLRVRPEDGGGVDEAIRFLADETDQMNAYYLVRFIMGPGMKHLPGVVKKGGTIRAMRKVAKRWPQNVYFAQSAARMAAKLK